VHPPRSIVNLREFLLARLRPIPWSNFTDSPRLLEWLPGCSPAWQTPLLMLVADRDPIANTDSRSKRTPEPKRLVMLKGAHFDP